MFHSIIKAHVMIVSITLFVGTLSYCAFQSDVQEIVLYNLPAGQTFTVVT
jgi:hypothetical protein